MEFDKHYKNIHISFQISADSNQLLTEAAALRLEDHLRRFRSIFELHQTVPQQPANAMEAQHDNPKNS